MKKNVYKPKPGDMEIRILKNGTVFMTLPDDRLMQVARAVDPNNETLPPLEEPQEIKNDARGHQSTTTG
jgi:hypothetical protein